MAETITVGVTEAHNRLSELINLVQTGVTVEIAKRGRVAARLVAPQTGRPVRKGYGPDIVVLLEEMERDRPAARRSAEEIDAGIQEEKASWERDRDGLWA